MTKKGQYIPVECGCTHNKTFWMTYCPAHRKEVAGARLEWDEFLRKLAEREAKYPEMPIQ